jgi:hypothetical protein
MNEPARTEPGRLRSACLAIMAAMAAAWGLFGFAFAFLGGSELMTPLMKQLWAPFLGDGSPDAATERLIAWVLGVLGSTMLSWAVVVLALIARPLRRGEDWAWWTVLAGVLAWFAIDESFSAWFGVTLNVVGNLVLLAGFLVPLALWKLAAPRN